MSDEVDWDNYETGPFCRHWDDFSDCKIVCTTCGHRCQDHNHNHSDSQNECLIDGCECKEFTDDE